MAKFTASLINQRGEHQVRMSVNDQLHSLEIAPKSEGIGSSISGGELLFLALATCYCNDLYREAGKRGIAVERVEVEVRGDFEREGGPATNVRYSARVKAAAGEAEVLELMRHTDTVTEIQNSLRTATPVVLEDCEVIA